MLILASGSPRRRALLAEKGLIFDIRVSDADETPPAGASPEEAALIVARRKAMAVARAPDDIVIGADTTVVSPDGEVFGKPKNEADARRMLGCLSGRTHTVITGVAVLRGEKIFERAVRTRVRFRALTAREVDAYLATGEPFDKAGAYGVQGRAGWFVESIEGDFYNVVGLPLEPLGELLREAGFDVWETGRETALFSG